MPVFDISYKLVDAYGRDKLKVFQVNSIDLPAAQTWAGLLTTALSNLTELRILEYAVRVPTVVVDTVDAGANRDEGATFQLRKADNQKHSVSIPGPVQGVRNPDGTIDIADPLVTAFWDLFIGGDGRVSDGETATELIKGTLDK